MPAPAAAAAANDTTSHSIFVPRQILDYRDDSIVGTVMGEYACTWETYNGSLYAGTKGIYFLGSFFLFERKLILHWEEIRQVLKVDQGIQVVCKGGNETMHEFCGVQGHGRVWALLVSLHNDALLDRRGKREAIAGTPSLRRRNSDPWNTACVIADDLFNDVILDDGNQADHEESSSKQRLPHIQVTIATPQKTDQQQQQHLRTSQAAWMNKSAQEIKAVVGELKMLPIPCSHEDAKGHFYVGEDSLYFFGRKFFWWDTKSVTLDWEAVRRIRVSVASNRTQVGDVTNSSKQGSNTSINNKQRTKQQQGQDETRGSLHFVANNGQTFDFVAVDDAASVWASLLELHNCKLAMSTTAAVAAGSANRPRLHRRMNSDPNMIFDVVPATKNDDNNSAGAVVAATLVNNSMGCLNSGVSFQAPKADDGDDGKDKKESGKGATRPKHEEDDDWSKVKQVGKFDKVVVQGCKLNCSLDEFFDLFLSDRAEHSICKFLESIGDSNVRASAWQEVGSGNHDNNSQQQMQQSSRVVTLIHPVNAPLAPPQAAARKEQTYKRYGSHGLVVETETFVDDVPLTDCFYVSDRILVQAVGDQHVFVDMEFTIAFIKSTMFKGVISKTTTSEITNFLEGYATYMVAACGGEPAPVEVETASKTFKRPEQAAEVSQKLLLFLIVLAFLLQIWIIAELRDLKASVRSLQAFLTRDNTVQ